MAVKVEKTPVNAPEFQSAGPQPNFKGSYPSKQKQFLSAVQTGTGSSQNIAHGLGHWRGPRPWATALARGLRTGSICSSDLRIRNLLNLNLDLRGRLWSRVLDSI